MIIYRAALIKAAEDRAPGYLEAVLSACQEEAGGELEIAVADYLRLTALYRLPATEISEKGPAHNPPTLLNRAQAAAEAAFQWALSGFPVVDEKTHLERSVQCSICPRWDARAGRCLECGCCALKLRLGTETCPLNRW